MTPELRARIIAYNKEIAEKKEKASDFDVLISEIVKLAPGQVKKFLSSEAVQAVLEKYGINLE